MSFSRIAVKKMFAAALFSSQKSIKKSKKRLNLGLCVKINRKKINKIRQSKKAKNMNEAQITAWLSSKELVKMGKSWLKMKYFTAKAKAARAMREILVFTSSNFRQLKINKAIKSTMRAIFAKNCNSGVLRKFEAIKKAKYPNKKPTKIPPPSRANALILALAKAAKNTKGKKTLKKWIK